MFGGVTKVRRRKKKMEKKGGVKYSITKEVRFDAAHKLPWYNGKCAALHGHTWKVLVTACRKDSGLDENGIVYDLSKLGKTLKIIAEGLDHTYLNDAFDNPTAEKIAMYFLNFITSDLGGLNSNVVVKRVVVEESPGSSVTLEC